jgi:hypothetical protein
MNSLSPWPPILVVASERLPRMEEGVWWNVAVEPSPSPGYGGFDLRLPQTPSASPPPLGFQALGPLTLSRGRVDS